MPGQIRKDSELWEAVNTEDVDVTSTKPARLTVPPKTKPSNGKTPASTIPKPTQPGGTLPSPFPKVYVPTVIGTSKTLTSKTAAANAAKKLKTSTAVVWSLKNTSAKAPESFEAVLSTYGPVESVFEQDDRKRVSAKDYSPGGKYRFKLFLIYQGSSGRKTLIATGWLISADVVVTAGHCVFDWEHSLNQVTEIKAYIGYEGRSSIGSPNVQFRKGIKVATTCEWLKSGESHNDVSFIKLQMPFKGIKPFKFENTPLTGTINLGVVGYPGHLTGRAILGLNTQSMEVWIWLIFMADTFGGNSGGPVIRSKDNVSIAVHVMGGKVNQASLIGPMGNIFEPYIQALTTSDTKLAKAPLEISWIEMQYPTSESGDDEAFEADPNGEAVDYNQDPANESNEDQPDPASEAYQFKRTWEQGRAFTLDFHNRLSAVGLPPSFGRTGRLAALYGHAILHTMHKRTKTRLEAGEDAETSESIDQGALGRAILAEAALDTILSLDSKTKQEMGIFDKLSQHSIKTNNQVEGFWNCKPSSQGTIGDKLVNVAMSTAASAILSGIGSLFKKKSKKESTSLDDQGGEAIGDAEGDRADEEREANGDENFDSSGGNEGLPRVPKVPKTPAGKPTKGNGATDHMPKVKIDLEGLIRRLLKYSEAETGNESIASLLNESAGTESLGESIPDLVESLEADEAGDVEGADQEAAEPNEMSEGLRSRIVLADAALETVLELGDFTPKGHSESFLGKLWGGVKKIGSFVASVGPGLLVSAASSAIIGKIIPQGKRETADKGIGDHDGADGEAVPKDGDETNDPNGEGMDAEADEEAAEESFEEWFKNKSNRKEDD
ncbi:hypothetical protein ACMFMF_008116 [Clarireedia jacksonii]